MVIYFKINDITEELFPKYKESGHKIEVLKEELIEYYTEGIHKPLVEINDGIVTITIDDISIENERSEYQAIVRLCEKGDFPNAKPRLIELLKKNPFNSEYHRILGQIYSEECDQDLAIDTLIDALRIDPENTHGLLMMGNILAKYKNDIPSAMKYYNQVIEIEPENHIAINNIGAFLMQQEKIAEAKTYFEKALSINPDYPNTHFAMAMVAETEGDLPSAFYSAITAITKSKTHDNLEKQAVELAFNVARQLAATEAGKQLFNDYLHKLEFEWDIKIKAIADETISTAAKMELAENYGRDHHLVRYKPAYPFREHLMMHELVHIQFMMEARKENTNQLFVSTPEGKKQFISDNRKWIEKMNKMKMTEETISKVISDLFDGINRQLFNTPIDLFIEDFLYNEYPGLRPYQFLSLFNLLNEGIHAVTEKNIVELSPGMVLRCSKILNIVTALHFKDLYGLDLTGVFKATKDESDTANTLYAEFLEYRDDREPGEEYELIENWGKDLKLDKYFIVHDEKSYRSSKSDFDSILENIENDPLGLETDQEEKQRQMDQFQESQKEIGTNMAVVMFMVDALQYMENLSTEKIRNIAFEIAMIGTQGIIPDKKGYVVGLIPGKSFSGYHLLAYYYVSWALAIPDMLEGLKLPYKEEFKLAKTLHKPGKL